MMTIFRRLVGATNGFNKVFETPTSYRPGSVRVYRNGLLLEPSLVDGFTEGGGNKVVMKEAPKETDIMQAFYISV
jgi:hypothetical protein